MSYQVVVSFAATPAEGVTREAFERVLAAHIRELRHAAVVGYVGEPHVAVHEIGAGGESSEDKGRWDAPPGPVEAPRAPQDPSGENQGTGDRTGRSGAFS